MRSWGVSYGLNAATEWRQIVVEALRGALVLVLMERLFLTSHGSWLEEHIDYLSLHSLLMTRTAANFSAQIKTFLTYTKRLSS